MKLKYKKEQINGIKFDYGTIYIDMHFFEGDIDTIIQSLVDIKQKLSQYNKFEFVYTENWIDQHTYELYGTRLETEEEAKARLKRAKATRELKKKKKAKDLEKKKKELIRLQKEIKKLEGV